METANIQQALAIYRLSDALIPTAVVGNVMLHPSDRWQSNPNHEPHQLYWSGFHSQGVSSIDAFDAVEGWDACELQLNGYLSRNPLQSIDLTTTQKTDFVSEVDSIKSMISQGLGNKIVAARTTVMEKRVDESSLWMSFQTLCAQYPSAFVFMLFDPQEGAWMGATPERLIDWEQGNARIMSLAGTLTQSQENWTGKERSEQSVTSSFIREKVSDLGIDPTETEVRELEMGNIRHLMSDWNFPLDRLQLHSLIDQLHPTPAVGGYPQEWAVNWILNNEGFDRGLYAGFIGVESSDFAKYHVVLRCCKVGSNGYQLFGGCGVNIDSDAETEWQETAAKMQLIATYL